jgi:two-component system, OmpR family, sensor kinase
MLLRTRLLLTLIGVVVFGLVISDVVTYALLQSYLQKRIDPQLSAVSGIVEVTKGLGPSIPEPLKPPMRTSKAPNSTFPGSKGIVPDGTLGALVASDGKIKGSIVSFTFESKKLVPPKLPDPLPSFGTGGTAVFDAKSLGPDSVSYRVLIQKVPDHDEYVMAAIPLTNVFVTLDDLRLIMSLVSLGVLVGLGVLSWWIMRRGFRPLEDIATTAGAIAQGDLGRRVALSDPRTEVGRLGLALNAMLGDIEAAMAERARAEARLRRFLADASHELRTPLTSIRGYAEMFDRGARERPADLETSMYHIRHEADRMNILVDDLLLLARTDQRRPLDLESVHLVKVARRAIDAAQVGAKGHPIFLKADSDAWLTCDAERLRQVLDNLLANAIHHSPADGSVHVAINACEEGRVRIEVADQGPGVAPEDSERVFEPFFRTDVSRVRDTGGTGLGLSIVAAIADAHGGTAGVMPNEGGGARFWVEFPAEEPPARW